MAGEKVDFTLCFRRLYDHATDSDASVGELFEFPDAFVPWLARWRQRLGADLLTPETRESRMRRANPALIPRNHRVEEAIRAAEDEGDFAPFNALVEVLAEPFHYDASKARYATPAMPEEAVCRTFCGT